jgi:hypothetical protein
MGRTGSGKERNASATTGGKEAVKDLARLLRGLGDHELLDYVNALQILGGNFFIAQTDPKGVFKK